MERVAQILGTVTGTEPDCIDENQNLRDDLGLSSLDVINLVVMFEEEFGIDIPDRHIMTFVTVGDVAAYLRGRV